MTGNPDVIKALQAAVAAESHLNIQYRLDWRSLKFLGVKKIACKIKSLGCDAHRFLKKVTDRLLLLGGNPGYVAAPVTEQPTLTATFQAELALEMAIIQPYEEAIQTSMKALDDTTRNLFEHLLKWHQQHVGWLEQQLRLIAGIGEDEYIAEKM
jgi:bacterioferritin